MQEQRPKRDLSDRQIAREASHIAEEKEMEYDAMTYMVRPVALSDIRRQARNTPQLIATRYQRRESQKQN